MEARPLCKRSLANSPFRWPCRCKHDIFDRIFPPPQFILTYDCSGVSSTLWRDERRPCIRSDCCWRQSKTHDAVPTTRAMTSLRRNSKRTGCWFFFSQRTTAGFRRHMWLKHAADTHGQGITKAHAALHVLRFIPVQLDRLDER
ncbi:hypothetical protein BAUCODRAFT_228888 [Baudoinia panamericana UAMH 10762]|uniref:Uncharacterized protein n=1 Tax=Baudoinia panamericana (strain UAMH 10762) TaxID=717646 RepID=M2MNU1_BAUPA|nr:uncharacterized protein BAUCODRAFT_228888 [Baudoinia panamericana UAMH 10762]EMC93123.1 hypothetical protein BAUCODRAFT_228888 [Baudoinia panamericana UAMH 10762]